MKEIFLFFLSLTFLISGSSIQTSENQKKLEPFFKELKPYASEYNFKELKEEITSCCDSNLQFYCIDRNQLDLLSQQNKAEEELSNNLKTIKIPFTLLPCYLRPLFNYYKKQNFTIKSQAILCHYFQLLFDTLSKLPIDKKNRKIEIDCESLNSIFKYVRNNYHLNFTIQSATFKEMATYVLMLLHKIFQDNKIDVTVAYTCNENNEFFTNEILNEINGNTITITYNKNNIFSLLNFFLKDIIKYENEIEKKYKIFFIAYNITTCLSVNNQFFIIPHEYFKPVFLDHDNLCTIFKNFFKAHGFRLQPLNISKFIGTVPERYKQVITTVLTEQTHFNNEMSKLDIPINQFIENLQGTDINNLSSELTKIKKGLLSLIGDQKLSIIFIGESKNKKILSIIQSINNNTYNYNYNKIIIIISIFSIGTIITTLICVKKFSNANRKTAHNY